MHQEDDIWNLLFSLCLCRWVSVCNGLMQGAVLHHELPVWSNAGRRSNLTLFGREHRYQSDEITNTGVSRKRFYIDLAFTPWAVIEFKSYFAGRWCHWPSYSVLHWCLLTVVCKQLWCLETFDKKKIRLFICPISPKRWLYSDWPSFDVPITRFARSFQFFPFTVGII